MSLDGRAERQQKSRAPSPKREGRASRFSHAGQQAAARKPSRPSRASLSYGKPDWQGTSGSSSSHLVQATREIAYEREVVREDEEIGDDCDWDQ